MKQIQMVHQMLGCHRRCLLRLAVWRGVGEPLLVVGGYDYLTEGDKVR